jgi:hypothetical protein
MSVPAEKRDATKLNLQKLFKQAAHVEPTPPVKAPAPPVKAPAPPVKAPAPPEKAPVKAPPVKAPPPAVKAPVKAPPPAAKAPVKAPPPAVKAPVKAPAPPVKALVKAPPPSVNAPVKAPPPPVKAHVKKPPVPPAKAPLKGILKKPPSAPSKSATPKQSEFETPVRSNASSASSSASTRGEKRTRLAIKTSPEESAAKKPKGSPALEIFNNLSKMAEDAGVSLEKLLKIMTSSGKLEVEDEDDELAELEAQAPNQLSKQALSP